MIIDASTKRFRPGFVRRLRSVLGCGLVTGVWLLSGWLATSRADGVADNQPQQVRRQPPLGIEVPADARARLEARLMELDGKLRQLHQEAREATQHLLPDVEIFYRAVHDALKYQELFQPAEIESAEKLLTNGMERADLLLSGQSPWVTARGLVVRGYRSRIDGSAQPYGLVVPESYQPHAATRHRLDLWFHGRGETLSEVNFLTQRQRDVGEFAPRDTFVLHPYGRYCNAFKFAGEVDVLEAMEAVRRDYPIDGDRIAVRGFSMGGAACWQFAVHYADQWFAAAPGAGFSETPRFLQSFQKETLAPTWYEEKLWRWYDCDRWARNLIHCPTVAYSGETDVQKQAADVMASALEDVGVPLVHLIGPKMGHRYDAESKRQIEERLEQIAHQGRQSVPAHVTFTTYTLRYPRMHWVTVEGLEQHWEPARVEAHLEGSDQVVVISENVTDLRLEMAPGTAPFAVPRAVHVVINGQSVGDVRVRSDRSWSTSLHRVDGQWNIGARKENGLRKRPLLQGPIDDAFMGPFLFVRPTGSPTHAAVGEWARAEMERAIEHWRRHFRGDARVKDDRDVTDDDLANFHLVLWGDPSSNVILGRIAKQLPIDWQRAAIQVGADSFPATHHALIAVYPNPLQPDHYVVLNSGFTFREFAYLNNARQVAKLPDWAVVDLRTPPDALWPGKIVAADFFDESWQLKRTKK